MIAAIAAWFGSSPAMIRIAKWVAVIATGVLFALALRRGGERAGRALEKLENMEAANARQKRMREAAADAPRDKRSLIERLRKHGL